MSPETYFQSAAQNVQTYRDLVEKGFDEFRTRYGADLQTAGYSFSGLFERGVVGPARQVFDASDALLATAAQLAAREASATYTPQHLQAELAKASGAAAGAWKVAVEDFNSGIRALAAALARQSYAKTPKDVDEGLLRGEAAMILDAATDRPEIALARLAAGARRDLAAVAVSPWAASWASTKGAGEREIEGVRAQAIAAASSTGSPAEAAAARCYEAAVGLEGYNFGLFAGMRSAADVASPGRGLGFESSNAVPIAPPSPATSAG